MTGMGGEGAGSMSEMHGIGSTTVVQREASCVVYGMPGEAVKLGSANHIVDLSDIPLFIVDHNKEGY